MTDQKPQPKDRFTLFLEVACVALLILTVLLTWQNRSLKVKLAEAAAAMAALPPTALKVGDRLDAFDVVDPTGAHAQIAFEGSGETLLLVFSSTCGACRDTLPTWDRMLSEAVPTTVKVVGLQTDLGNAAGSVPAIPELRFPVFGMSDPAAEPMSKFPMIPAAALIDNTGAVTAAWFGVPTDAQVSELRRRLKS